MIESKGPTNTRIYVVAVYFRDERLATGNGHSIQEAEMNAATNALTNSSKSTFSIFPVYITILYFCSNLTLYILFQLFLSYTELFPHLAMQKRIIEKRRQEKSNKNN